MTEVIILYFQSTINFLKGATFNECTLKKKKKKLQSFQLFTFDYKGGNKR